MVALVQTVCLCILALGLAILDDGPLAVIVVAVGVLALVALGMRRLTGAAGRLARDSDSGLAAPD